MPNLIYRVVAPCAQLGCGFPEESFETALQDGVDAIVCDAGSMDAGPFYLGSGRSCAPLEEVRKDLEKMIAAADRLGRPLILGSAGFSGADRSLAAVVNIVGDIFAGLGIRDAAVATISAELAVEQVIADFRRGALRPLGRGTVLTEESLRRSTIVGQMGVHPIIGALAGGAQYIIAGRACDAALFAADMIRRGINPGLAFHVGRVLACGAMACEPSSGSDCLVAEIYDDQSALFIAPNPRRRCTVHSIAAHSLYAEAHPYLQTFPEGILNTEDTRYHSVDSRSAGISGSRFLRGAAPRGVKLEGAQRLGHRRVSLLYVDPADLERIPGDLLVYGGHGVQMTPGPDVTRERGIIVETNGMTFESALLLAEALAAHLCRFSYPGRKGGSDNVFHALSPPAICFKRADGSFGALLPLGTTDSFIFEHLGRIEAAVLERIEAQMPDALASASHRITPVDSANPAVLVRTIDVDRERLAERHLAELERIAARLRFKPGSLLNLEAPDAYQWSVFHVLQNERTIRGEMFPITHYRASGRTWTAVGVRQPEYIEIADRDPSCNLDPLTLSAIDDTEPEGRCVGTMRLVDMASIIRSKSVGVDRLTFDLVFNSGENYESALYSNTFSRFNVARILQVPLGQVIGTYFVDACNAIKITIDRPLMIAGPPECDSYGGQQEALFERLSIPIYARSLQTPSSF